MNKQTSTKTKTTAQCMTAEEVAAWFRVSVQSVRAWARAGTLPAFRLGTQLRFDPAEIAEAVRLREANRDDE